MIKQTIALFRYQLLGLINGKILLFLLAIYTTAFLGSRFMAELAIINSETIASAAMADFIRYSLVLMLIVSLSHQVAQDYELNQFDRILAMPLSRFQYVLAQVMVMLVFSLILTLPILPLFMLFQDGPLSLYWTIAVFLELVLAGLFAMLAVISLEKLPISVIFTFCLYLLAKAAPLINVIFKQSGAFYEEEKGFVLADWLFSVIDFVLPDVSAFAQNDLLFAVNGFVPALLNQLSTVVVYGLFILFVVLLDFYRKEFNQT